MPAPTVVSRTLDDSGGILRYLLTMSDGSTVAIPYAEIASSAASKGTAVTTAVTVGTTATLLLAANLNRKSATFVNNSAGVTVYLGPTAGVTTATGTPFLAGATAEDRDTTGAWYGIVASGTADVRVAEVS